MVDEIGKNVGGLFHENWIFQRLKQGLIFFFLTQFLIPWMLENCSLTVKFYGRLNIKKKKSHVVIHTSVCTHFEYSIGSYGNKLQILHTRTSLELINPKKN